MILVNTSSSDDFKAIHDDSFPLPDLSNKLYINKKLAIEKDRVLAAGLVKLTCEGILVIDRDLPLLTKVRVIRTLIANQADEVKKLGLEDCHLFVKNDRMRAFLIKLGTINLEHESPMMIRL